MEERILAFEAALQQAGSTIAALRQQVHQQGVHKENSLHHSAGIFWLALSLERVASPSAQGFTSGEEVVDGTAVVKRGVVVRSVSAAPRRRLRRRRLLRPPSLRLPLLAQSPARPAELDAANALPFFSSLKGKYEILKTWLKDI